MDKIKLSIIIPVYQAECFIETAIKSILRQRASWVEIVLVNDGSRDNSEKICKKYESDSVRYIAIQNHGAGYARNRGIEYARGERIAFLDSDDLIFSNALSNNLYEKLCKAEEEEIDIIYGSKIECDMELVGKPVVVFPEKNIENYMPKSEFWACIYHTDFIKKKKIKFFEYRKQDIETAFRFRAFSQAQNICIAPDVLLCVHRFNTASNVHTWRLKDMLEIKACVYFQLFNEYRNQDPKVASFLQSQALYCFKDFLIQCFKGVTQENKEQMKNIVIASKNCVPIPWRELPIRYVIFRLFVSIIQNNNILRIILWSMPRRTESIASNCNQLISDDVDLILSRLDMYQEVVQVAIATDDTAREK